MLPREWNTTSAPAVDVYHLFLYNPEHSLILAVPFLLPRSLEHQSSLSSARALRSMLPRAFPSHVQPFRSFISRHYSISQPQFPRPTHNRPWAQSHSSRLTALSALHSRQTQHIPCFPHLYARLFSTSSPLRDSRHSSEQHNDTTPPTHTKPQPKLSSSLSPFSSGRTGLEDGTDEGVSRASSFRKIAALAYPERKPLLTAVGLLLVSSAVTLSIPFSVGKLIDFFTTPEPVRLFVYVYL